MRKRGVLLLVLLVVGAGLAPAQAGPAQGWAGGGSVAGGRPASWAWHIETVDSAGDVGQYTSVAFSADNIPHIAYYAAGDLKHAYISDTVWVVETVDITGDVGVFAHIAVTGPGRVGIAYYDATGQDLKYWDSAGTWTGVVDSGGNVGQYTSLAFDAYGYPHISYYDVTNGNLKYAHREQFIPGWVIAVVDGALGAADVGRYTSIALIASAANAPAISYYDVTNGNLRYAELVDGWTFSVVDSTGDVGQWTALQLAAGQLPHITYTAGGTTLKHAWRAGTTWNLETVAVAMQGYNSLALDNAGRPHVSYQQEGTLRYAYFDGTAWQYEPVDAGGEVGAYNSLALDRAGYPHISYRDATNFDLRYAFACCDAQFTVTPQPQCQQQPVAFLNYSSGVGKPFTYLWAFGDGGTSTEISPTHTYADGGTYTAWLTTTAHCGVDTMTATVVISSTPEADFTYGPLPVCAEWKTVQFTNTTVGSPTLTYEWVSNDGWTSTAAHPTHTFALPGEYDVVLIATNGCGLDTVTQQVHAHDAPEEVQPTWWPQPPEVGHVVTFTGQVTSSLPVEFWLWEFGDGGMATGEVATYTYATTGTHTVRLTAANGCGTNFGEAEITVVCYPVAGPDFTWEPVSPTLGFPTTFAATVGGGTTPVAYAWNFGDGQTGAGAVVQHTYVATGTYSVVLTATNYCGVETVTHAVVVVALPQAAFTSNAPVCDGAPVVFTNLSGGAEPLTFLWHFGDGQTSPLREPTHTYAAAGDYNVTLTVTNPYGQDVTTGPVLVVAGVSAADFTWLPANPAPGQVVTLTATTNGTEPVTYEWDLGDGYTGTGRVVTHAYATTATYTVTLQAANDCGTASAAHVLNVSFCTAPTGLAVAHRPPAPLVGEVVYFTLTLAGGSEPLTWAVDFGDGSAYGYGPLVTHTYTATGTYTVAAAAWNACGYAGPVELALPVTPLVTRVYLPLVLRHFCAGDAYEPDNTPVQAKLLVLGGGQRHNFQPQGDVDWLWLSLTAGGAYHFETSGLTGGADTRLWLYQPGDYDTPVAQNDDCGADLWSCFDYTPTASGVYYLKVDQYPSNPPSGCDVQYTVTATQSP